MLAVTVTCRKPNLLHRSTRRTACSLLTMASSRSNSDRGIAAVAAETEPNM